ncbi:MAG: ABC transporter permease [Myxococcota bacterium]|nr:ABC transporter permease [Myxococcota bacterium]
MSAKAEVRPRRNLRLLAHLTWWDLVAQYFGSWVGLLWNILLPAMVIVVYLAVFEFSPKFVFGGWNTVGGYGINLVTALIPWLMFQEGVARASASFVDQRHLLTQIPVPSALFPLANVSSAVVRHFIGLTLVIIILLAGGVFTGWHWFGLLLIFPILLLLTVGCAIVAACLTTIHRDVAPTVSAGMLPLFFTTPVIYPPHIVPQPLRVVMDLNPLSPIVVAYRDLLVTGVMPMPGALLWSAAVGLVIMAIALILIRRIGPELAERI